METHRVQHEAVDSLTCRQNQHGGAAVEGVTRGNDLSTWQQGVLLGRFAVVVLKHAQTDKYYCNILLTFGRSGSISAKQSVVRLRNCCSPVALIWSFSNFAKKNRLKHQAPDVQR